MQVAVDPRLPHLHLMRGYDRNLANLLWREGHAQYGGQRQFPKNDGCGVLINVPHLDFLLQRGLPHVCDSSCVNSRDHSECHRLLSRNLQHGTECFNEPVDGFHHRSPSVLLLQVSDVSVSAEELEQEPEASAREHPQRHPRKRHYF